MTIQNLSKINRLHRSPQVTFGDVVYQPGGTCGPRVQTDFQLVILYSGALDVQVDEQWRNIPPQFVILMQPGHREFFQFAMDQASHHSWCAVHPTLVPTALALASASAQGSAYLPLTSGLQTLMEFGLSLPTSDLPTTQAVIEQVGLAALYEFVREGESAHSADRLPSAVRLARQMIDQRFAEPLTLTDLAHAASVTPQHLIRLFRKHLHITPARYLWQVRLDRGMVLLRETGLSISEIATRTGFQSAFHFSRLIKQRYHQSPRDLRAKLWEG